MFQNMGNPCGILGRGPEGYPKDLVLVIVNNRNHPCACFFMLVNIGYGCYFPDLAFFLEGNSLHHDGILLN